MERIFNSSGYADPGVYRSEGGEEIDFDRIPPFLRVLLTTDGTVTKSIESYFWEPVKVGTVRQEKRRLEEDIPAIGKHRNDEVIFRQVVLQGERSGKTYTRADSYIISERLPPDIRVALEAGKIGIGEILRECNLETYREIIAIGQDEQQVWRVYRIVRNHQVMMQISEYFPVATYQSA